jgi:hypothetical protein
MVKNVLFEYKDQLLAGMIVAGWDAADGPSVFSVPLGGSIMRQKYALGGSGSTYILSHCDDEYRDDMSRSETQQFVARGTLSPHLYSLSFSHIWRAIVRLAQARHGRSRRCRVHVHRRRLSSPPGQRHLIDSEKIDIPYHTPIILKFAYLEKQS